MFCSKCGTEHSDDSQFCRKCGQGLAVAVTGGAGAAVAPARVPETPKVTPQVTPAAQPKKVRAPFAVIGILFAGLLAYGFLASRQNSGFSNSTLAKQLHTVKVANPVTAVGSSQFSYFKLDVPPGATNVLLKGDFTANGGSGNDIETYVFAEPDYINWQNGHAAKTFYQSGKVTVGNFKVTLPSDAGTYYLVFNNRFSLLSQKTIRVDGLLTFYQ